MVNAATLKNLKPSALAKWTKTPTKTTTKTKAQTRITSQDKIAARSPLRLDTKTTSGNMLNMIVNQQAPPTPKTKAQIRAEGTTSKAGINTFISNITHPISAMKKSANAWKDIFSKTSQIYSKADDVLYGGMLPFGVTPTKSATRRTNQKIADTKANITANKVLNETQIEDDYSKQNWFEKIPLVGDWFISEEEEDYQKVQDLLANRNILERQAQLAETGDYSIIPTSSTPKTNWLGYGAIALAGMALMLGMKK